jgi:ParB family chromosome partitioning protein
MDAGEHSPYNAGAMQRERKLGKGLGQLMSGGPKSPTPTPPPQTASPNPSPQAPPQPAPAAPVVAETPGSRKVRKVPIARIAVNPWQPRVDFATEELEELIASIREQGLIQPITVRERSGGFQLVAGERRLRACRELGWTEIDALTIEATDQQMLEWAIIENLQRASLNPVETAQSFRRLIDEFSLTQDEASRRLGQSRAHVANTLRLLELPADLLGHVSRGTIAPGAGRALLGLSDHAKQRQLADRIVKDQLSVRQVEDLVRALKKVAPAKTAEEASGTPDPNRDAAAQDLQDALGTKVKIVGSGARGTIRIEYHSQRQLRELYDRLLKASPINKGREQDD